MKKVLLLLALGASLPAMAQVLQVGNVEKINIPQSSTAKVAAISPQGDYLLLTNDRNSGLTRFDLASGQARTITTADGAGYDVKISPDGQNIVYRETSINDKHLRMTSLHTANLATGETAEVLKPTHDLQGYVANATTVGYVNRGKFKAQAIGSQKADKKVPVLSINKQQLMMTQNGKTRVFSPNGTSHSYIWPSLSPDGTKVLYYVCGMGAYVCDLDGSNVKRIGEMRAPKWYDDNTIVGMLDKDDGEFIYASTIVAANLDGTTQTITDDSTIAMYPQTAQGMIVFSTPAGEAYMIHVSK